MFRKYVVVLTISLTIVSCKKIYYAPREINVNEVAPTYDIKLEKTNIECMGLMSILAVDSTIVVISSDKQSMIQVFNYDGSNIAKLSPSGRAKNEFLKVGYAWRNIVVNGDRCLYLYDQMKNEFFLYNLSASIRKGYNDTLVSLLKKTDFFTEYVFFRGDKSYFKYKTVSYDDPRDMRFSPPEYTLVYPDGKKKKYEIIPDLVNFSEGNILQITLSDVVVRMSNDGKKVIAVSSYEDRMTFIDLESDDCFGVRGKDFVDISRMSNSPIDVIRKKCIEGVNQVVVSDDYIFVLYDNRTVYESEELNVPRKTTIRVFNWEGVFLAELTPDISLFDFSIDFDKKILIGCDLDEKIYTTNLTFLFDHLKNDCKQ